MKKIIKGIVLLSSLLFLTGCEETTKPKEVVKAEGKSENSEMEVLLKKKHWTPEDYQFVLSDMEFKFEEREFYPYFGDSETAVIIEKLIDTENFKVIANDDKLSLREKTETIEAFIDVVRDLSNKYIGLNADKDFIYGLEMIRLTIFDSELQIYSIKLMNEYILEVAPDPNEELAVNAIQQNKQMAVSNYSLYLQYVPDAGHFDKKALEAYTEGIDVLFPNLILNFPDADYTELIAIADLMTYKTEDPKLKTALENLVKLLESKEK